MTHEQYAIMHEVLATSYVTRSHLANKSQYFRENEIVHSIK